MSSPRAHQRSTGWSAPRAAAVLAVVSVGAGLVAGSVLLTLLGPLAWQEAVVRWFNEVPRLLGAVLAAVNPLLRPVPLTLVSFALVGWVLLTAADRASRLELVRAGAIGFVAAEVLAHGIKAAVAQPRPVEVMAGLDTHGYPGDPRGHSYPSAHTAVATAVLVAMWPGMRPSVRVVGAVFVVLVATNRIYVGAHWPLDVVGGAGIGLLCAAAAWWVASRWPLGAATIGHGIS